MNTPTSTIYEIDEELSQAKARTAAWLISLIYFLAVNYWADISTATFQAALLVFGLFGVYVFTITLLLFRYPGNYPLRRVMTIIIDIIGVSAAMSLVGEYAAFFYPLYLWIIIGNGIRFGIVYLFIAMTIGTIGFTFLINQSNYWIEQQYLSYGLLSGCFVLPLFFVSLIRRLHYLNNHLDEMVSRQTRKQVKLIDELELANNRTSIATQVSEIGIWELNIATDSMHTDKIAARLLGLAEDFNDFTFNQYIQRIYADDRYMIKNAQKNISDNNSQVSIEHRYQYSDKELRWHKIQAATIVDENHKPVKVIGGILDITDQKENEAKLANYNKELESTVNKRTADLERSLELLADKTIELQSEVAQSKAYEAQLKHMAMHDMLTNLPNRTLLNELAEKTLVTAKRYGQIVAVIFIDLDGFKAVNDNNSHEVGDAVLVEISLRISETVREVDILGRIGGDEFIVLLPNCPSIEEIENIAYRILKSISEPIESLNIKEKLSASMGIATYPEDSKNWDELLRLADIAMYRSKKDGKNRITFHHS